MEENEDTSTVEPERKFSLKNAGKEFCQGFATPFQELVNLVKNPKGLATAAIGGIGIGALSKNVKSFPKFAIIGTSLIGIWNIAKGAFKYAN